MKLTKEEVRIVANAFGKAVAYVTGIILVIMVGNILLWVFGDFCRFVLLIVCIIALVLIFWYAGAQFDLDGYRRTKEKEKKD